MPKVSPSVLIIRLDAIGDALALTPSIAALRRRAIAVDVVLRDANANAFSPRAVRDVIVADFELRDGTRSNVNAIERLGRDLRERRYTHVCVATEDPGGYRLAAAIGAPTRIGFEDPWTKPLKALWSRRILTTSVYRSAELTARSPHECETLFKLVEPLVGDEKPTRDLAQLRPLVLESEPAPDDRVAVQITDKWERLGHSDRVRRGFGAPPCCRRRASSPVVAQRIRLRTIGGARDGNRRHAISTISRPGKRDRRRRCARCSRFGSACTSQG